jgi:hypothetical protein
MASRLLPNCARAEPTSHWSYLKTMGDPDNAPAICSWLNVSTSLLVAIAMAGASLATNRLASDDGLERISSTKDGKPAGASPIIGRRTRRGSSLVGGRAFCKAPLAHRERRLTRRVRSRPRSGSEFSLRLMRGRVVADQKRLPEHSSFACDCEPPLPPKAEADRRTCHSVLGGW